MRLFQKAGHLEDSVSAEVPLDRDEGNHVADEGTFKVVSNNGFRLGRDYLLPVQERMISLTGGLWEQNPGW